MHTGSLTTVRYVLLYKYSTFYGQCTTDIHMANVLPTHLDTVTLFLHWLVTNVSYLGNRGGIENSIKKRDEETAEDKRVTTRLVVNDK